MTTPTPDTDRARALADELREVHRRLRAALDLALDAGADAGSEDPHADPARDPLLYCWGFCAALEGHHRSEDDSLFPLLLRAHPDLAPVVGQLRQDHRMIDHLLGSLREAIRSGADADERARHLEGVAAIMESHFRFEERRVLPLLDALDPDGVPAAADLYGPLA
ncbi:hemerythrin domain-containing protein [Cellulomonas sp. H30R-01]|nr:hemerythrin domain-containing protein [Cellulomonas sp. H30R-01]